MTTSRQAAVVKERAVRIGRPTPLVGIVSEPAAFDPERPAVLIFNSGVMHHIGTCRLSVKLARAFSGIGNLSIRFDFSGIGDSESRRGTDSFEETAAKEAIEVMDYLQQKRGIKKFVVYGLCSGADASYMTALTDERVIGFAQIDPYCYRTIGYYYHYYASRIFVLERWSSSAKRLLAAVTGNGKKQTASAVSGIDEEHLEFPTYDREFPPREEIYTGLKTLFSRGVENYVIFTGGMEEYNYRSQYRDSFRGIVFNDLLHVDHLASASHIITNPRHQKIVIKSLTDWLESLTGRMIAKNASA